MRHDLRARATGVPARTVPSARRRPPRATPVPPPKRPLKMAPLAEPAPPAALPLVTTFNETPISQLPPAGVYDGYEQVSMVQRGITVRGGLGLIGQFGAPTYPLGVSQGGTGKSLSTPGALLVGNGSSAFAETQVGAIGQILTGGQPPIWLSQGNAGQLLISNGPGAELGWTDPIYLQGPQGVPGPAGPQGVQGTDGPQGPQGALGPDGPAGPQGIQGPPGEYVSIVGSFTTKSPSSLPPNGFIPANWDSAGNPASDIQLIPGQGLVYTVDGSIWEYTGYGAGWVNLGAIAGPQGPIGPAGPAGPQGVQGIPGPQGVQGTIGPTGLAGPTGQIGPAGPVGPAGVAGQQGQQGVQGDLGPTGPQGPAGPQGAPGQTAIIVGSFTTKNPSSLPSNGYIPASWDSPGNPPSAIQMETGQGLLYTVNDNVWIYVGIAMVPGGWTNLGAVQGPPGPTGIQGPVGPQGVQGVTGPAGSQGPTGPQGATGQLGPVGPPGAPGTTGPAGPQGDPGPQGPAGNDGATGQTGPAGPQGPIGPTGPTGPQGPQGVTGANVFTGDTPPPSPVDNLLWFDSTRCQLFIRYNDGNSSQWVVTVTADISGFLPISGGTMTGDLVLPATSPATSNSAAPKSYVDAGDASTLTSAKSYADGNFLRLTGGTLSGGLTGTTLNLSGTLTGAAATLTGSLGVGIAPPSDSTQPMVRVSGGGVSIAYDNETPANSQAFVGSNVYRNVSGDGGWKSIDTTLPSCLMVMRSAQSFGLYVAPATTGSPAWVGAPLSCGAITSGNISATGTMQCTGNASFATGGGNTYFAGNGNFYLGLTSGQPILSFAPGNYIYYDGSSAIVANGPFGVNGVLRSYTGRVVSQLGSNPSLTAYDPTHGYASCLFCDQSGGAIIGDADANGVPQNYRFSIDRSSNATVYGGLFVTNNISVSANAINFQGSGGSGIYSDASYYQVGESASPLNASAWKNYFAKSGGTRVWVNNAGTSLFSISGAGACTCPGGFSTGSDATQKRDIEPANDVGMDVLRKITPSYFVRIQDERPEGDPIPKALETRELGFIAQDVQAALPDAIIRVTTPMTGASSLAVQIMPLLAVLANAVKELDKRLAAIEALEARGGG